jgi:hydroxydechloroatrazine ethylaminohydrolase
MPRRLVLRNARAVVTCDGQDRVLRDADLAVEGQAITALGRSLPVEGAEVLDARGKLVYPGLVNTHHHFFQAFVRNLLAVDYPSLSVMDWIARIYPIFQLVDAEAVYHASLAAMADLLAHGCTCAFDHQYCFPRHAGKELVDRQVEAAALLGIRFHAGRGANTLPTSEGSAIPEALVESTDEFLADCERLIDRYHDPAPFSRCRIAVAPCQPVNCRRETFPEAAALARARGVLLHTHLGEGENAPMVARWGKRTLAWCEELGFVGPDVWIAHGWELGPDEHRALARTGTGLSHCPAPAVLGGFPILDLPALAAAGVRLGLGCDGSATNDGSSLLDTLRMAYLMQAFHAKQRGACPTPYQLLKLACAGGADLLGRPDLGSLEVGKAADLFLVDGDRLELAGALHDPANLLARTGVAGPVHLTMVGGEVVFAEGRLQRVDERRLAEEAERACDRAIRWRSEAYGPPPRAGQG